MTRLLACSEKELGSYPRTNLEIGKGVGNTFVHRNMRNDPLVDEVGYPSYNKPASVMFWLDQVDVKEEFIALLDTDMQLREPLDPVALGARRGVVVSAEYAYLVGTKGKFVRRFLEAEEEPLAAQCGGFHIFHRDDIRTIAPLWIEFTRRVRAFAKAEPELYFSESFLNWQHAASESPEVIARHLHMACSQPTDATRTLPLASPRRWWPRGVDRGSGRRRCMGTSLAQHGPGSHMWCAATRCSIRAMLLLEGPFRPSSTMGPTISWTPCPARTRPQPRPMLPPLPQPLRLPTVALTSTLIR